MKAEAPEALVETVVARLEKRGFEVHRSDGAARTILGAIGDRSADVREFEQLEGVDTVIRITRPYRLAARDFRPEGTVVKVGGALHRRTGDRGDGRPLLGGEPGAGARAARAVRRAGATVLRGGAFKPRSSPYSFQGLGEDGLRHLREAADAEGLLVVTEVLDVGQVPLVAEYADLIQVGARNMQNYAVLRALGQIRKPVLLKRGMSATIEDWLLSAEYILHGGNYDVVLCERGIRTFETATRNTLDLSAVPVVKRLSHLPVIVDPSHGTGYRDLVRPMSRAAVAAGADGLLIEVHPLPDDALSDGPQSLTPAEFADTDGGRGAGGPRPRPAAGPRPRRAGGLTADESVPTPGRDAVLIVMNKTATPDDVQHVITHVEGLGFKAHPIPGALRTAIGITGNQGPLDPRPFEDLPGVQEAIPVSKPFKLVSREWRNRGHGGVGGAGPDRRRTPGGDGRSVRRGDRCEQALTDRRRGAAGRGHRSSAAGRSSRGPRPTRSRGSGEEGLKILAQVREETGLPVVTEAMDAEIVDLVEEYADMIQIGARNMQNFTLLKRAGTLHAAGPAEAGHVRHASRSCCMAAEYIMSEGNSERGPLRARECGPSPTTPATRSTCRAMPAVKRLSHLPIIVDPSHGTGKRDKVAPMARAAVAAGADGLMVEVHHDRRRPSPTASSRSIPTSSPR